MESDAALPGLAVDEERVNVGNVHYHSIPLVQIYFFQMVLITLVLGEIYKYLQGGGKKRREELALA